jgi:hypothetical protein
LNRFLFSFGDNTAQGDAFAPRQRAELPQDVIAWLQKVRKGSGGNLADLSFGLTPHNVRPTPVVLNLDDQAVTVMRELQSEVERRKKLAKAAGMAEIWVRNVEKGMRLALIAAVSTGAPIIERHHADWAIRRVLASDSALERAATGNISETNHGKLCNYIWNAVAKYGPRGIAEGKLATVCRPYRDAAPRERRDALATTMADGRIAALTIHGKDGRPSVHLVAMKLRTSGG